MTKHVPTLLDACKMAEAALTDAWRDWVQSRYPRHQWDLIDRPDLVGDFKDQFGDYHFPLARALNHVRDAISATEEGNLA